MRIGVIGAIGVDDIGDIVMLELALKQLKEIAQKLQMDVSFTIFSFDVDKTKEMLKKIYVKAEIVSCLQREDLIDFSFSKTSFSKIVENNPQRIVNNQKFLNKFNQCNALFFIGGGYFNSYWGEKLFPTFILPIALAQQFKKTIYISGINIGPFNEKQIKNLYGVFKNVDILTLRDRELSLTTLEKLGGPDRKLILGADDILPVWYDNYDKRNDFKIVENDKYAVIQLHHWVETYNENYIKFYKILSKFLNDILNKERIEKVIFIPFTYFKGADYECGRRLKTFLNDREKYIVLEPTEDHILMRQLISESSLVIASRYHPIVFGLGENVPTLGIYVNDLYEHKISGAYDTVGVDKDRNMIYLNDISYAKLMNWYKYCTNEEKNKSDREFVVNEYAKIRKESIEEFLDIVQKQYSLI